MGGKLKRHGKEQEAGRVESGPNDQASPTQVSGVPAEDVSLDGPKRRDVVPAAELAWRHIRKEKRDLFDRADKLWPTYCDQNPGAELRPWSTVYCHIVANRHHHLPVSQQGLFGNVYNRKVTADAVDLLVFGAYRNTKTVYEVDPVLMDAISGSKWPDKLPCEAIQIPKNGMVLDLPATPLLQQITGSRERLQVLLIQTPRLTDKIPPALDIMPFVYSNGSVRHPSGLSAMLDLSKPNLQAAHDAVMDIFKDPKFKGYLESAGGVDDVLKRFEGNAAKTMALVKTVLSLCLYITGNDDVLNISLPSKDRKTSPKPEKERRFRDLDDPTVHSVGSKYASVIQRWADDNPDEAGQMSMEGGRSVKPHLRAAHSHLYMTGKGRTVPRVHFLPPIPVKGWNPPEEDVVVRLVK
jgi:hypothetical protein